VIELPGETVDELTPKRIVEYLDRYVVGQDAAKRAVAIALRNRIRRQRLNGEMAEEVVPKNIIMIGPTGVGKTELARRLSRLTSSPFLKVEASKFTEVGYVGRDAESMIRDLVDIAVKLVREERVEAVASKSSELAEQRLLDLLLPSGADPDMESPTREKLLADLRAGRLDHRLVEVETSDTPSSSVQVFSPGGMEDMEVNLREMLPGIFGSKTEKRKVKVSEAREILRRNEESRLVDMAEVAREALSRVENSGVVFLDEIDKIASRDGAGKGPDVSREGVQRDILPIVEGTTVNTKYGMLKTDHILFVAAGAFHISKPSDLIPELQGRFPIRVELDALTEADFVRILTEPRNALTKQYVALLETEGIELVFEESGVALIAEYAALANDRMENIGARRLHTLLERALDEILFEGAELDDKKQVIDANFIEQAVADVVKDPDLSRYIL
jgi:ATP-dependent HslUV protease ATP-binding subunit HslU